MLSLWEVALWLIALVLEAWRWVNFVVVKEPALRVLERDDGRLSPAKGCLHIVYNRTYVLVNKKVLESSITKRNIS